MVVFLLPVGILMVSHMSTDSIQSVPGTSIIARDTTKLVRIVSPANTALEGTLQSDGCRFEAV